MGVGVAAGLGKGVGADDATAAGVDAVPLSGDVTSRAPPAPHTARTSAATPTDSNPRRLTGVSVLHIVAYNRTVAYVPTSWNPTRR